MQHNTNREATKISAFSSRKSMNILQLKKLNLLIKNK